LAVPVSGSVAGWFLQGSLAWISGMARRGGRENRVGQDDRLLQGAGQIAAQSLPKSEQSNCPEGLRDGECG